MSSGRELVSKLRGDGAEPEGSTGGGLRWRPVGSNGPATGEDGRKAGGSMGEGACGQENDQEDDGQAPEGICQGRCQLHSSEGGVRSRVRLLLPRRKS